LPRKNFGGDQVFVLAKNEILAAARVCCRKTIFVNGAKLHLPRKSFRLGRVFVGEDAFLSSSCFQFWPRAFAIERGQRKCEQTRLGVM